MRAPVSPLHAPARSEEAPAPAPRSHRSRLSRITRFLPGDPRRCLRCSLPRTESCDPRCAAGAPFLRQGSPRVSTSGALLAAPRELQPRASGENAVTAFWGSWEPGPRTRTISSKLERALAEQAKWEGLGVGAASKPVPI